VATRCQDISRKNSLSTVSFGYNFINILIFVAI
jgi:hypothetical protein